MIHRSSIKYLKKDLEKDAQKNRLDNLLLHTSTLLGIILALSQTIIDSKDLLKSFIPLFLLIWLIPVYVGYIKGAIVYDLLSERLRGWIYLIEGTLTYFIFLGVFFLRTKPGIEISDLDNCIVVALLLSLTFFGIIIYKKFIKFFGAEISDVEKYVIRRTTPLPLFLGVSSLFYLILVDVEISTIEEVINDMGFFVGIGVIIGLVLFVCCVERGNKKIIKKLDDHPKLIDKNPFTIDSIILISSFVLSFLILLSSIYIFNNFWVTFIFLFVILILVYVIIFRLLFYNKSVVFN